LDEKHSDERGEHRSFDYRCGNLHDSVAPPAVKHLSNNFSSTSGRNREHFRPDIQGLRAIAVGLVLAFHFGLPGLKGGFIGVDVFFVISGYLITEILVRELQSTGRIDFVKFYGRRAARLLPACLLMTLCVGIFSALVLSPLEQEGVYKSSLATATYVSNIYFAHVTNDYFAAQSSLNPLLHTWSLAVEEQFYALWPLMLVLAFRLRRSVHPIVQIVCGVSILSLAVCVFFTSHNQPWAFFLTPMRAWEFGAGAILSLGCLDAVQNSRFMRPLGWIGLLVVVVAGLAFSEKTLFPGIVSAIPVLGTCAVLLAGRSGSKGGVGSLLSLRPFQLLGDMSYSLYLWHWPVVVLAKALKPSITVFDVAACLLITFVLSSASFVFVEKPLRANAYLKLRPAVSVGSLLVATAFSVLLCFSWGHWIGQQPQYQQFNAVMADIPELFSKGCDVRFTERQLRVCNFGDVTSPTSVVLFGDSHAAQWFPAVEQIAKNEKWKVVTLIKSSCPAANVAVYRRTPAWEEDCENWRREALKKIAEIKPAAVFVGNYSGYGAPGRPADLLSYDNWLTGYRRTMEDLQPSGSKIVFLSDTPTLHYDSLRCFARVAWTQQGECPAPNRADVVNSVASEALTVAASDYSKSYVLDLNDDICSKQNCPLSRDGKPIYRDMNHLTQSFVRSLTPEVSSRVVPIVSAGAQQASNQIPVVSAMGAGKATIAR
jgi:peptidoglycan/LPS O-acetylase OafA/YrhL